MFGERSSRKRSWNRIARDCLSRCLSWFGAVARQLIALHIPLLKRAESKRESCEAQL
jgi:hypothetical protein